MTIRTLSAACFILLMSVTANAQTKISGTLKCDKSDPSYSIDVGDRPGHIMLLGKNTCSYTQPVELNGDKSKDGYTVGSTDASSTHMVSTGTHVTIMQSGDKTFINFRGTTTIKDGKPEDDHGTWIYTGGTGKLKGIKGKGTYKTTVNADDTATIEVEGEYELPQPKPPTKK